VEHEEFGVDVTLTLVFAVDALPAFANQLQELTAGQVDVVEV
jgi:hypothetical protein